MRVYKLESWYDKPEIIELEAEKETPGFFVIKGRREIKITEYRILSVTKEEVIAHWEQKKSELRERKGNEWNDATRQLYQVRSLRTKQD